jgi:predicted metal-dependent hydrolase
LLCSANGEPETKGEKKKREKAEAKEREKAEKEQKRLAKEAAEKAKREAADVVSNLLQRQSTFWGRDGLTGRH